MAVIRNLPNSNGAFLLDADARFYQAQPQGNAYVYVEKYATLKDNFSPLTIGTRSSTRDGYLVKETNYTDIGGGLATFERHFAVLPTEWHTYEQVTYQKLEMRNLDGETFTIINKDSITPGTAAMSTLLGTSTLSGYYMFFDGSTSSLAKATRTYYQADTFQPEVLQLDQLAHIDPSGDVKVQPDSMRIYMPGIYEVTSYEITF